jgi:hypothetical protein
MKKGDSVSLKSPQSIRIKDTFECSFLEISAGVIGIIEDVQQDSLVRIRFQITDTISIEKAVSVDQLQFL